MSPDIRHSKGWIEVICGSMFSGKTAELIRRITRARLAKFSTIQFKPQVDNRYHPEHLVSHDKDILEAIPVSTSAEILQHIANHQLVGIDEAQFFDNDLPQVLDELANRKIRVIAAGLDMDYLGNPFGPMPALIARAEYVTKIHAVCMRCGELAAYTYRSPNGTRNQVEIGEKDLYEALCRSCYRDAMASHES